MNAKRNLHGNRIMLLIAAFSMMLMVGAASAQTVLSNAATDALSVTHLNVGPQPVYPGQNVTITFQLYNSYGALTNVNLGLQGTYPLLNYSPSSTQLISSIGQGIYGGAGSYFTYTVHIPRFTAAGSYTLDLVATYEASETVSGSTEDIASESVMPITIYVSGKPNIVLNANPTGPIVPGLADKVAITGLNVGTDMARNVSFTVLDNPNFTVVGTDHINLGGISEGSFASGDIVLQANSTLLGGAHYIPVVLTYASIYGANTSARLDVPISVVINQPNIVLSVSSAQPQFLYAGNNQTLAVSIQNIGTGEAKNVTIGFGSTPYIGVGSSSSSFFLGSLGAGSSTTEDVFITANKNANGTSYALPALIAYKNANYQQTFNATQNVPIKLQQGAIFTVQGVNTSLTPGATFVPITFVVKNMGSEEADDVSLSLQTVYPVTPINSNGYIAKLAPGQSQSVTFYVSVDPNGNAGTYPVILFEQWTQPNGQTSQQYTSSQNYYAPITTSGSGRSSLLTYAVIIAVVVAVAAGFIWMRRGRGKEAANKKEGRGQGK